MQIICITSGASYGAKLEPNPTQPNPTQPNPTCWNSIFYLTYHLQLYQFNKLVIATIYTYHLHVFQLYPSHLHAFQWYPIECKIFLKKHIGSCGIYIGEEVVLMQGAVANQA
jgi:hypothetical protein